MTRGVNAVTESATETTPGHRPLEHYTVRWPFLEEILGRFQMEPTRDCFASEENKRFPLCYTKEQDALAQEWGKEEVLWMNPPWRLWPEATQKLMASQCAAICILPAWSKGWVQQLVGAAHTRMYFERGVRMFELDGRPAQNTLWGVWALKINKGTRPQADQEAVL